jgi:hypothetical protein
VPLRSVVRPTEVLYSIPSGRHWRRGCGRARCGDAGPAALLAASQMGIWGTGKSSRDATRMLQACEAVCGYLEELRA